jgi:hypothetical protein
VSSDQKQRHVYSEEKSKGDTMTMGQFMEDQMTSTSDDDAGDDEPLYCFTKKEIASIVDKIEHPPFFLDRKRFMPPAQKIFSLGPTNSGSNFHMHADGWFTLVHGEKRFIMYPAGERVWCIVCSV